MAFFEEIAVSIGLDPSDVRKGARAAIGALNDVRKAAKDVGSGLKTVGDGFSKMGEGFEQFAKVTGLFITSTAGVATAIFSLTEASAAAADAAGKSSEALGLTTEQYGRLSFAASQADLSQEEFSRAFVEFADQVQAAQRGDKNALKLFQRLGVRINYTDGTFKDLGVSLFDTRGRALSVMKVFDQVANNVTRVGKSAATTDRIADLFGKRIGPKMIPLLLEGSRGIKELGDEAVKLGVVFTEQQAKIGDDFGDALDRTKAALTGVRNQIGLTFAPEFTQRLDEITAAIVRARPELVRLAVEGFDFMRQAVLDLIHAFQGKDSQVVGKWAIEVRDKVVEAAGIIKSAFDEIIFPLFNKIHAVFDDIAAAINKHFGTDLTGAELLVAAFVFKLTGGFTVLFGAIQTVVGVFQILIGLLQVLGSPLVLRGLTLLGDLAAKALLALAAPLAALLGLPAGLVAAFVAAGVVIAVFWDDIVAGLKKVWDYAGKVGAAIIDIFKKVGAAIAGFFSFGGDGSLSVTPPEGFAEGGLVGGQPGRDKNVARLTKGEFVNTAATVRSLGVPFFEALERGLVPAFAVGGGEGSGSSVNLFLKDGSQVSLRGDRSSIAKLLNSDQFALSPLNRWARR